MEEGEKRTVVVVVLQEVVRKERERSRHHLKVRTTLQGCDHTQSSKPFKVMFCCWQGTVCLPQSEEDIWRGEGLFFSSIYCHYCKSPLKLFLSNSDNFYIGSILFPLSLSSLGFLYSCLSLSCSIVS